MLGVTRAGEGTIRVGRGAIATSWDEVQIFLKRGTQSLIPPHVLTNFEMQKCYKNEPRFNGTYSRNNLPKIKDGSFVINLDECKSVGTHWIALFLNGDNLISFDNFRVEHIPKEI